MHYLPLLGLLIVLKVAVVFMLGGPRRVWSFAKDCVTIGEDHWTWTTRTGEWFEDAEVEAIEQGELVLKHRYGMVRVAIDRLSEKSRHLLHQTGKWADYLASVPTEGKITPFVLEPVTAEAA